MKKLKNKVLIIITTILTLFLITILFIYNYQNYRTLQNNIKNNLHRMEQSVPIKKDNLNFSKEDKKVPKEEPDNIEQKMFMDTMIYTILLDNDDNIKQIISHYEWGLDDDKLKDIAQSILSKQNKKDIYIGNLYITKYSYSYIKNKTLIIIDNTDINNILISNLKTSIIIFILLETIIVIVSILLTRWVIKPVEESFQKQKQFIADASHELKTPLAIIIASSEALEKDRKEQKWLDNIKNESERMNKLITNLLDLAKIENQVNKQEYSIQNLSKIVEKSVLTFESLSFEKNIELKYNIEDNIKFNCNTDNIKQLLSILLDNAIKHCLKDGDIEVNLHKEKNNIILEVKNRGLEIPKNEEEKIFERFYRVDKARNRNENRYGLGLAIAKEIVLNHNGKISAYSKEGYTTFLIIFNNK